MSKQDISQLEEDRKVAKEQHADHGLDAVDLTPPELVKHEDDNIKAEISWRSWLAVSSCALAISASAFASESKQIQEIERSNSVYVVVGPASVIAFIARDLGGDGIGWILQAPLLVQTVLSPIIGRLSDLTDRKWMAVCFPILAAVGCVISARATSVNMLIGGGVLIGFSLPTIAIVTAIPSEILPMKWRPVANGICYIAGNIGGWAGGLAAGGVVKTASWRDAYWIQLGLQAATALGLLVFYRPPKRFYPKTTLQELLWAIDSIGAILFTIGATLTLIALNWAPATYPWRSAHVIAPLVVGIIFLGFFTVYEWKGRDDGIVAHVFFKNNRNFFLSTFGFTVEGYLFYGAVNQFTNQIVLNLGFQTDAWLISLRQLCFSLAGFIASLVFSLWATKLKDLKTPLLISFLFFLASTIAYGFIQPSPGWNTGQQWGLNIVAGIGQAGPLTLIVTLVMFCAPSALLANATGLAFSGRAIGGAFGSAILGTVIDSWLAGRPAKVANAATNAGLPMSSVTALLEAMAAGTSLSAVPGATSASIAAAVSASQHAYAKAYQVGYLSIVPFIVVALVCTALLKDVKHLMTEHVAAPVEDVHRSLHKDDAEALSKGTIS